MSESLLFKKTDRIGEIKMKGFVLDIGLMALVFAMVGCASGASWKTDSAPHPAYDAETMKTLADPQQDCFIRSRNSMLIIHARDSGKSKAEQKAQYDDGSSTNAMRSAYQASFDMMIDDVYAHPDIHPFTYFMYVHLVCKLRHDGLSTPRNFDRVYPRALACQKSDPEEMNKVKSAVCLVKAIGGEAALKAEGMTR